MHEPRLPSAPSPSSSSSSSLSTMALGLGLLAAAGCQTTPDEEPPPVYDVNAPEPVPLEVVAEARLLAVGGSRPTSALARFRENDEGELDLDLDVFRGPHGVHGVQILARRDCDFARGGELAHYAPKGGEHGLRTSRERHLGDLGNVKIDAAGYGDLEAEVPSLAIKAEGLHSIIGRAMVIRAERDFGEGDAGGRVIACGVIQESVAPVGGSPPGHWLAP